MERSAFGGSPPHDKVVPRTGAETLDDKELVRRAQNYDAEALSRLYEIYYPRVYSYALVQLGNIAEAEDMAAEVLLKVLESLHRYRERGVPFAAWVFRIARNNLIDRHRHQRRRPQQELSETLPFQGDSPHAIAERNQEEQQVRAALDYLTDEQRQVITLKFVEEMDNASIARVMGKTEGAVKALQHRALVALRKVLTATERQDRHG